MQVRRISLAACVALGLWLVSPAWAAAATVSVETFGGLYPRVPPQTWVNYNAAPGEISDLVVSSEGPDLVRLSDSGSPMSPGSGCAAVSANEVTCSTPAGSRPITDMNVYLGDGADRVEMRIGVSASVRGEDGDDTIDARGADGRATLSGGAGKDSLRGGPGRDGLQGGSGPDTLRGGGGSDVLDGDDDGLSPPGRMDLASDVMNGGPGVDAVSYQYHPGAVRVDLALGRGGARGERDELAGIENVEGSDSADVLLGDAGPNVLKAFDSPSSGPGDRLVGRAGNDWILGGRGRDFIAVEGDQVATCGPGRDLVDMTYAISSKDGRPRYLEDGVPPLVGRTCETVHIDGAGRLASLHLSRDAVRWVVMLTALDRRIHCGGQVTLRAVAGQGRGPVLGRERVRYRGARAPIVVRLDRAGGRAIARHKIVEVEVIAYRDVETTAHEPCFNPTNSSDPNLYRIRL